MVLAALLNDDGTGQPLLESLGGSPVDAGSVIVQTARLGDADLDGDVDIADYFRVDRGRALGLDGWQHGDFDLSGGPPTADDYLLIDGAFQAVTSPTGPDAGQ